MINRSWAEESTISKKISFSASSIRTLMKSLIENLITSIWKRRCNSVSLIHSIILRQRSQAINSKRIKKMNARNDLMRELIEDAKQLLKEQMQNNK